MSENRNGSENISKPRFAAHIRSRASLDEKAIVRVSVVPLPARGSG